ncbi:MAG: anti-sigma factor [Flavobacteriia bacterium]|nr:anti-sigma factor [Flavobacteriia bacterium]
MKKLIPIFCFLMIFIGCTETDIINETGEMEITDISLPELPNGYFYQGWLLVDGSFVSAGTITNDSIANNYARFSKIDASDLSNAQSFAITVETSSGAPSDYVLLIGDFEGNTAQLSPNAIASNGVRTLGQKISAGYTVQNASVPPEEAGNYGTNGIWFFKGSDDNKEPTLGLDYHGLRYQAWLIKTFEGNDWYLNMGQIESDTIADNWRNFIPAPFVPNIPDFPGEDFLQQPGSGTSYPEGFFPADVRGSKVVLTPIFTNYNNAEIPFPIFLLRSDVPADAVKDPNLVREMEINNNYSLKAKKL